MRMPPTDSGKSLTKADIEILKQWIAEGAEYQGHWSFISPIRRDPPATKFGEHVRNAIDNFILDRLEAEGLRRRRKRTRFR